MAAESSAGIAATGDEVGRLYAEYGAKLHRFCRGRLRSNEEAEDAVQTTFLRVYTALRQGTVPQYEAAWLYKIAHNVCLSRIESSERRARIESPQDFSLLEDELAAPTGRGDELVGLADALAAMPPNLRQAILLREWQGLSYAEISEALGVSVSAVESLIFRARRHLANALVEPAKKVAGALNLPWLAGAARSLLANLRNAGAEAGLGMKIAAGVGLVAIGGGGAGLGLTVGASGHPRRELTVRPAAASSPAAGVSAPAAAPRGEMAAVIAAGTARRKHAATSGKRGGGTTSHAKSPGQTTPSTPFTPVTTPVGDPSPPATTPTRPGTTSPPGSTTPQVVPAPGLPPTPTVPLPTVAVPTLPAPTVPVPTVPAPTVTVPPVTVPTLPVTVPTVTVPVITTPTVTLP